MSLLVVPPRPPTNTRLHVSIVIPAYNAAETLADTLNAICAQVCPAWEAIVVDDGSTDATATIARSFAGREARIRVVTQSNGGEAAARNAGIGTVQYDWVLFLDADDWIAPLHLERLTAELGADPGLDAVHCGSVRVAADGTQVGDGYDPPAGDMFSTLARRAAFPVHACIVRRALIETLGGFDSSLRTSTDWDLWQRVARTGARFGAVREVLAYYRMRPGSASLDAAQLFRDGLRVLKQGHAPDPRVLHPHPAHAGGSPPSEVACQQFYLLTWCAGLAIGGGRSALPLLDLIPDARCRGLDADAIAECLFRAGTLPTCVTAVAWETLWPSVRAFIEEFLRALEAHSQTPALSEAALLNLKRRILTASPTWTSVIEAAERSRQEHANLQTQLWVRLGVRMRLLRPPGHRAPGSSD